MHYPLVIIGGGTAALAAIAEALELGVERVAYVERRKGIGGECAMNGCVPAHTMLAGAKAFHGFKKAAAFGVGVPPLKMDFGALMEKVERVVASGLANPYADEPRVTLYHGQASFVSPTELKIDNDSETVRISADHIVVATGAKPFIPDIAGLEETGYWLYPQATHADRLPASLAVIGAGRIGTEFAQLFQRLGSRVTLMENQCQLFYREDEDVAAALLDVLEQDGVQIRLSCEIANVETVESRNGGKLKRLNYVDTSGALQSVDVEEILVNAGRVGCPKDLNLEAAGVQADDNGIIVDDRCRTNVEHIWAVGDVAGPYRFTHAADYQAVVAVQNALRFRETRLNYDAMPRAYYTDPPFARIGLTERQARERYQTVIVLKSSLENVTRLRLEGETQGLCKVIVDGDTDQILGAHILAAHADDTIHMVALAMHAGVTVPQMAQMVYAYPTRAQILQKTLELYRKARTEMRAVSFGAMEVQG